MLLLCYYSILGPTIGSSVGSRMSCLYQLPEFVAKFQESLQCRPGEAAHHARNVFGQRAWPSTATAATQQQLTATPTDG